MCRQLEIECAIIKGVTNIFKIFQIQKDEMHIVLNIVTAR